MAKKVTSYSFKGEYDHENGTITEYTKDDEKTFDLVSVLEEFNGKSVTISIKEDNEPNPMGYGNDDAYTSEE